MGVRRELRGPRWIAAVVLVALATAAVWPRGALATRCPAPAGASPSLETRDARERLQWIDARLTETASRGRTWAWGWALGIGAAGVGSLAAVPFVKREDRVDWYAGAVSAAIGVVPFVVSPLTVTREAPRLHLALTALPSDDDAGVCPLLVDAEHKLDASAANQAWQQGWWIHAGNVAFNTGLLLFLGLGYHHWTSGIINGVAGAAVGEVIIFTQPTSTVDDAALYRRGTWSNAW